MMDRTIKFRGKRIDNGEWVYGDLLQPTEICDIYEIANCESIDGTRYEVIPDTTGQYTSLKDKNGKEIYEGDILKSIQWNDIYLVKYIGTAFYLCRKVNNGFNKITTWNNTEKSEVIGNIYDNPELLGGKDEC